MNKLLQTLSDYPESLVHHHLARVFGVGPVYACLITLSDEAALKIVRMREAKPLYVEVDANSRDGIKEEYVRMALLDFGENRVVKISRTQVEIHATDRAQAAALASELMARSKVRRREKPFFYVLKSNTYGMDTHEVPVDTAKALPAPLLDLHYGAGFGEWDSDLCARLKREKSGLTLLRGAPGTGKSSYIRSLIRRLQRTHRFYYLPVAQFGLVTETQLTEFWAEQARENPGRGHGRILILEDAESLLMRRAADNRESVANILNLADGLLGEFFRLHLICTANCDLGDLDPALLRPGRLQSVREFRPLDRGEAQALCDHHKLPLPETGHQFTLADLFARPALPQPDASGKRRKVGFSS